MNVNPNIMTVAAGSFNVESTGVICGTAYPDPAARFALSGGILAATETLPMWGGVAIQEFIPQSTPAPQPDKVLGEQIKRAVALAGITGFCVYDQNYAAINTPQSPAPQASPGGFIAFYRLGCGIRLALEMDPALALDGLVTTTPCTWDFTNQRIIAGAGPLPVKILRTFSGNCMAASYASGTGFLTWNRNAAAAICLI